jgi:hypothetical protein
MIQSWSICQLQIKSALLQMDGEGAHRLTDRRGRRCQALSGVHSTPLAPPSTAQQRGALLSCQGAPDS